ncbi:hypothetical protein N9U59_01995 [Gammaproteobacteria bacterium]|jgi:hypothetical protein|nr:hypothetical protein [Gammaproteobacteria bacterium]
MISKYLTTICLLLGTMLPLIVDTGSTHLLNPDWDAHSRVHEVWRLSTNIFIAVIGLYLLWVSNYLLLPALLSSCIVLGFFSAIFTMSLYGGVTIGEGIEEPNPFGIPANIFVFITIGIIQSVSFIFLFKNR